MDTLTIDELIAALQKARERYGNLPVVTEGCDCDGEAQAVEHYSYGGEECVYIARNPWPKEESSG